MNDIWILRHHAHNVWNCAPKRNERNRNTTANNQRWMEKISMFGPLPMWCPTTRRWSIVDQQRFIFIFHFYYFIFYLSFYSDFSLIATVSCVSFKFLELSDAILSDLWWGYVVAMACLVLQWLNCQWSKEMMANVRHSSW